jgi:small-conductance mechanosensitive channel
MIKKIKISGDIVFAAIVLLFLFVLILNSGDLPVRSKRLPLLIAWITVALTVAELAISVLKQSKRREDNEKAVDSKIIKKTVVSIIVMLSIIIFWNLLGFIVASIAVAVGFAFFLGAKNKLGVVIASICVTLALYYVFHSFLGVPLPRGMLFTRLF